MKFKTTKKIPMAKPLRILDEFNEIKFIGTKNELKAELR